MALRLWHASGQRAVSNGTSDRGPRADTNRRAHTPRITNAPLALQLGIPAGQASLGKSGQLRSEMPAQVPRTVSRETAAPPVSRTVSRKVTADHPLAAIMSRSVEVCPILRSDNAKYKPHVRVATQISDRFGVLATKGAIQKLQENMQTLHRMRTSADRAEPFLSVGQRVAHHLHGPGVVLEVNLHDSASKPYHILFDNGQVQCFSNDASAQLQLAPKVHVIHTHMSRGVSHAACRVVCAACCLL